MNWKGSYHTLYMQSFGQALTLVETHRVLSEMREDRLFSIASAMAESKRAQAKYVSAMATLNADNQPKSFIRRSEAFVIETKARTLIAQPCLDMARMELGFINHCLDKVVEFLGFAPTVIQWQEYQSYETAYELAINMALHSGPPNPDVLRNLFSHEYCDEITAVMLSFRAQYTEGDNIRTLIQGLLKTNIKDLSKSDLTTSLQVDWKAYNLLDNTGAEQYQLSHNEYFTGIEGVINEDGRSPRESQDDSRLGAAGPRGYLPPSGSPLRGE